MGWIAHEFGGWTRDDGEVFISAEDGEWIVYKVRDPAKALDQNSMLFNDDLSKVWTYYDGQEAFTHGDSIESGTEPKYGWDDEKATLDDYDRWYGEGKVMKLDRKALREMILAEVRTLRENVDASLIAKQIAENYGDMFASEGAIDSQVENHVYHELIEAGHMTEASPDFDLLDEVMDELAKLGIVSEAGMGSGGQFLRGRGVRTREDLYGDHGGGGDREAPDDTKAREMIRKVIKQQGLDDRREALAVIQDKGRHGELTQIVSTVKGEFPTFHEDDLLAKVKSELMKSMGYAAESKKLTTESIRRMIMAELPVLGQPTSLRGVDLTETFKPGSRVRFRPDRSNTPDDYGLTRDGFEQMMEQAGETGTVSAVMLEYDDVPVYVDVVLDSGFRLTEHNVREFVPVKRNIQESVGSLTDILVG